MLSYAHLCPSVGLMVSRSVLKKGKLHFHAPIGAIVSIFVSSVSVQKFAFQFILLEANLGHCVISL